MIGALALPRILFAATPWKRIIAAGSAVVAAGGIGFGIYKGAGGGGGGGGATANAWIDTNGGTCTRNSTPAVYSDAAACSSLSAAWSAMSSGDTTRIKDGTYTSGCLFSTAKTSTTTFIGNGSSTKFVCEIDGGNYAKLQDLEGNDADINHDNITFQNVDLTCTDSAPYFLYQPANRCSSSIAVDGNNFNFDGGSVGPMYDSSDCSPPVAAPFSAISTGGSDPNGVTFTNVKFHNVYNTGCNSQHSELLRIDGGSNITFNRSWFDCGGTTGAVFVSTNGNNVAGGAPSNVTFKNTFITAPGGCGTPSSGIFGDGADVALAIHTDSTAGNPTNFIVENVVTTGGLLFDSGNGTYSNQLKIANTIWDGANPCPYETGVIYTHNAPYRNSVDGGSTDQCGGDTAQVGVGTTSDNPGPPSAWLTCGSTCMSTPTPNSWKVKASSPLINAGTNTYNPGTDYGGVITRPCGTNVEVGMWEYGC